MKRFFERYATLIGLLLLTFIIIFLFSTPSTIFARQITTIGTELDLATGDEVAVRTKIDFGNNEHMQAFNHEIGDWSGSDFNAPGVAAQLGADVMLLRAYSHPDLYVPMEFLIMQSHNRSSFHPPIVCYPALGYSIEEEGREVLLVQNISWVADRWLQVSQPSTVPIVVKKLVVATRSTETNRLTERKVVLYFYLNERPFRSASITMVRVSAPVPTEGSYDGVLGISKDFMAETLPYMFELEQDDEPLILSLLASGSCATQCALVMIFLLPASLLLYPSMRKLQLKRNGH